MASRKTAVTVSEIMTSQVRTARPSQPLEEILDLLKQEHCHHVPIVDQGRPVGMVSARDVVHLARRRDGEEFCIDVDRQDSVGDAMNEALVTIHADEPVDLAIERIGRGDIHALVVLDDDGKLAGIITHNDLLGFLID
ncbi:MAG: HPP family protein [Myxococcota bacterium]